jgi:Transglycosylase-like domain
MAAVIVLASLALPAEPAFARVPRKIKAIKAALVRIEHALDVARADMTPLEHEIRSKASDLRAAKATAFPIGQGDGLVGFPLLNGLVRVAEARAERAEARRRIGMLRERIDSLLAQRLATVDELQAIVQRKRARKPSLPSFSVGGSLITYSADWEATAQCESGGDWHINSSKDGGLQFLPATWLGFGGGEIARHAYQATKLEQISIAERVLVIQGPKAWPTCFTPLPASF